MKIYCMRHGESRYNVLGLCNDDPARDVHLTPLGEEQSRAAARRLKKVPFERILTSELPRTRETAEIINAVHRVPVMTHAALNDIRSGFGGRPVREYFAAIADEPLRARPPGGESRLQHKQRIFGLIAWLLKQPLDCVLVIAHEETLRAITAWFSPISDAQMLDLAFGNGEVVEFDSATRATR
jgi:broad specificity phosphatase PhoE